MIRVVIDTNVALSGILFGGIPGALLNYLSSGIIIGLSSEELISELKDTLTREKFRPVIEKRQLNIELLLDQYRSLVEVVHNPPLVKSDVRDIDDDIVLACAAGGQADYVVTGDKDLLVLKDFEGIKILQPVELLEKITEG